MATPAMQLKTFKIEGLFDIRNHSVTFPIQIEGNIRPAVVILHGLNGVGKTTMLRMLDGLLRLAPDSFSPMVD